MAEVITGVLDVLNTGKLLDVPQSKSSYMSISSFDVCLVDDVYRGWEIEKDR